MNPTTDFPAIPTAPLALTPSALTQAEGSAGSLFEYYFELAARSLDQVDPIPPAPRSSACALDGAQDNKMEPVGSPHLCDWSMDARPTYKLTDAELLDKERWQLEALRKCEVLKRAMDVPTIYPEAK